MTMRRVWMFLPGVFLVIVVPGLAEERTAPFQEAHVAFQFRAGVLGERGQSNRLPPGAIIVQPQGPRTALPKFSIEFPFSRQAQPRPSAIFVGQVHGVDPISNGPPLPVLSVEITTPPSQPARDVLPKDLAWFINLDLLTEEERTHVLELIREAPGSHTRPARTGAAPGSPSRSRRPPR
jgi:hypothetical protein